MSVEQKDYYTPAEAAAIMHVSRSTMYAILDECPPRIRSVRIGQINRRGKRLIPASEIARFLDRLKEGD